MRAGEALLRAAEEDPEAYPGVWRMLRLQRYAQEHPEFLEALRAAWEPLRQCQQAIRAAAQFLPPMRAATAVPVQAVMAAIAKEYFAQLAAIRAGIEEVDKTEFEVLLGDIREAEAEADRQWAAQFPCSRPHTVEDWERLAVRSGVSPDLILKGEWAPTDILPIVEGYFHRLRDQDRATAGKTASPSGPSGCRQQSWANDLSEYLPLTEIRKLIDKGLSLQTLGRLCRPDGEIRYMRRKGLGCRMHIGDFRRYMKGRQSDPEWAAAYMHWLKGQKAGGKRLFWKCGNAVCGHEYPDDASASDTCPKCKSRSDLIVRTPPRPRR